MVGLVDEPLQNEPQLVLTNRVKTNLSLARLVNILETRARVVC